MEGDNEIDDFSKLTHLKSSVGPIPSRAFVAQIFISKFKIAARI